MNVEKMLSELTDLELLEKIREVIELEEGLEDFDRDVHLLKVLLNEERLLRKFTRKIV